MNHAYVNSQASRGICAHTGEPFNPSKGGGGDSDDFGGGSGFKNSPPLKPLKEEELPKEARYCEKYKLYVDNNEWDLSDVEDIERPCRDFCYWILKHKNGKKTRVSGNVILEEI